MRRLLISLLIMTVVSSSMADTRRRSVRVPVSPSGGPYLDAAIMAGSWLLSLERISGNGSAWPSVGTGEPSAGVPGLSGTSAVGAFFIRLHQVTRNPLWLDKAKRAAVSVAAQCTNHSSFDWQVGTTGCGQFLLALYRETREPIQLERTKAIADGLLAKGIRDDDGGLHWEFEPTVTRNVFTGIAHGAAGPGMFFLQLYQVAPEPKYLEAAEAAMRWIERYQVSLRDDAIGWKRIITDTHSYNGWCGGASGMIAFLRELHKVTQKAEYHDLLTKTANGLVVAALESPGGVRWTYNSARTGSSPLVYCHGSGASIGALAEAIGETGNGAYAETARKAVDYLLTIAVRDGDDHLGWEHIAGSDMRQHGFMVGGASIGHAYVDLYRATRETRYLTLAKAAGNFLLKHAQHPKPDQSRWPALVEPVNPNFAAEQTYSTGWWDGTAGIGMYLIELQEVANGKLTPIEFGIANP